MRDRVPSKVMLYNETHSSDFYIQTDSRHTGVHRHTLSLVRAQNHRMIEEFVLEGTLKGYLVQMFLP